jgi:small subunit ribosomal protein S2
MPVATRRELLEAGIHFGHQTRRWNPKMRRFIFAERSGIYIIDLEKTRSGLQEAYNFLLDIGRRGGTVLFVGTKKQAQETIAENASRVAMPYVTTRWLGGMLTNFQTIHSRLRRLRELREMERSGAFEYLPKKEVLKLRHEKDKLERNLSGIQDMERLPEAVYVIDTKREHIAVKEARKLGIPVIAIVDTNCDPDEVDYVVPGNDDAIRSCSLITRIVADAIQEGQYLQYQGMAQRTYEPEFQEEPAPPVGDAEPDAEVARPRVQLSEEEQAFFGTAVEGDGSAPEASEEAAQDESQKEPAAVADAPLQDDALTETQSSATWAAPADASPEDASTHPEVAGMIEEPQGLEQIEAELDGIVVEEIPSEPVPDQGEGASEAAEAPDPQETARPGGAPEPGEAPGAAAIEDPATATEEREPPEESGAAPPADPFSQGEQPAPEPRSGEEDRRALADSLWGPGTETTPGGGAHANDRAQGDGDDRDDATS